VDELTDTYSGVLVDPRKYCERNDRGGALASHNRLNAGQ
jgi:hypothetical protein